MVETEKKYDLKLISANYKIGTEIIKPWGIIQLLFLSNYSYAKLPCV